MGGLISATGSANITQLKPRMVLVDGKMRLEAAPLVNIVAASRENAMAVSNYNRQITVLDNHSGSSGHVTHYFLLLILSSLDHFP